MTFQVPEQEVIAWRRHIHANPELSFKEFKTADYVERVLHDLGIETMRPIETSIVGTLEGAADNGIATTLALRADMDALPVQEETGEPFASTVPGVMHACGHDAHTAMLLGTAKTLAGMTDRFGGTVKFFFQHAEELNPGAAAAMIEAGCMEGVDFIYGFHVMNGRKGTIGITPGPATSSAGGWFLTVQGKGSHGSMPHHGVDPALCASMIVVALNHVVARNTDPDHFVVVNPGAIQSGSAPNVIPDTARIGCSIRVYDPEDLELVYRRADEVVEGICKAYGCTYEFERVPAYAVTVNDLKLVELGLAAARTALGGEEMAYEVKPSSGSEDFSAFANVVPGCFVQLMGGDASDGLPYMNHHPRFNIVEQPTLANGVRAEVQIVLAVLGDGALEGHKNQPVRG